MKIWVAGIIVLSCTLFVSACVRQPNVDAIVSADQEQDKNVGWISDQNGCKHLNPKPVKDERVTWSGGCIDGFASGHGEQTWYVPGKTSNRFSGSMVRGKFDGYGVIVRSDGSEFRAVWSEGQYVDGTGSAWIKNQNGYRHLKITDKTGLTVTWTGGADTEGYASGNGEARWRDKDGALIKIFKGELINGKASGKGSLTFPKPQSVKVNDPATVTGEFKDGFVHGYAEVIYWDGGSYKGFFENGRYNGKGKRIYARQGSGYVHVLASYSGEFENNFIRDDGYGLASYWDGTSFEGIWRNGEPYDGEGQCLYDDKLIHCRFAEGRGIDSPKLNSKSYGLKVSPLFLEITGHSYDFLILAN